MPKVVGGLAALVALIAGIGAGVDPLVCLWRGALAFAIGLIGTQAWYVFFATRVNDVSEVANVPSGAGIASNRTVHGEDH